MGLRLLLTQRGLKRWMVPPLALTVLAFAALLVWIGATLSGWLEASLSPAAELLPWAPSWVAAPVQWTVERGWALLAAKATAFLALVALGSVLWWYCFSVVFEVIAGPFLDEIHGRLEERWFGADPRAATRPTELSATQRTRRSALALAAALAATIAVALLAPGAWAWLALAAPPAVAAAAARLDPAWGAWGLWWLRVEARAAWASVTSTLFTLVLLVLALPLALVPAVGWLLFGGLAGFATAIGLMDVAFSRRGYGLAARLRLLRRHAGPVVLFGAVCGLGYSVPFLGPLLVVPGASVGGLWLLLRLDKQLPAAAAP